VKRTLFTPEHEDFRHLVRDFIAKDVLPFYDEWLTAGVVPRDLYRRLAEIGVMGIQLPETHGGSGQQDYRYNVVLQEEMARVAVTLGALRTHLDVVLPYFLTYADAEQRDRWFPGLANGELYTALSR
jgi:acyl-CoA dehydrogenase